MLAWTILIALIFRGQGSKSTLFSIILWEAWVRLYELGIQKLLWVERVNQLPHLLQQKSSHLQCEHQPHKLFILFQFYHTLQLKEHHRNLWLLGDQLWIYTRYANPFFSLFIPLIFYTNLYHLHLLRILIIPSVSFIHRILYLQLRYWSIKRQFLSISSPMLHILKESYIQGTHLYPSTQ